MGIYEDFKKLLMYRLKEIQQLDNTLMGEYLEHLIEDLEESDKK